MRRTLRLATLNFVCAVTLCACVEQVCGQATAVLRVKTDVSDVEVWIDGQSAGRTPLTLRNLVPGRHQIALLKDGFADHVEVLELSTFQPTSIFVVMKRLELQMPDLPAEFKAIHQHRTGSCVGVITITKDALDYKAKNDEDNFHIPIATIKSVSRSWGPVAGLFTLGIRGPTDLMAFRIETSGRSYGFLAFKDTVDDPMKVASEKTRELYEVVFRLWSATLPGAPKQNK